MGVIMPQKSHRYNEMIKAAEDYYSLLDKIGGAQTDQKKLLKAKLDEKLLPYEGDTAFVAFLKYQREAKLRENAPS
jgi:hypothetical protein